MRLRSNAARSRRRLRARGCDKAEAQATTSASNNCRRRNFAYWFTGVWGLLHSEQSRAADICGYREFKHRCAISSFTADRNRTVADARSFAFAFAVAFTVTSAFSFSVSQDSFSANLDFTHARDRRSGVDQRPRYRTKTGRQTHDLADQRRQD